METIRLNHFCKVYEYSSIRKSAELLHLSPGSVSKSIKQLEFELGDILFVAEGRGIRATDFAHSLYPKAIDILQNIAALRFKEEKSKQIKIAAGESTGSFLIAPVLNKYFQDYQVSLYQLASGEAERAVADRQIDWALTFEPRAQEGIILHSLAKIQMQIYVSRKVKSEKLSDLSFIVPTAPLGKVPNIERGQDGWPEHILERKVKLKVDGLNTAIQLARHGSDAIFLPEFVGHQISDLKIFKSDQKVHNQKRTLYLMTRPGDDLRTECKRFASMIRTVLTKN